MMSILQRSEISEFYTHHVDLLHYCLTCPNISQNLLYRVLNLWLIESDGDIKPLSFNYDKVAEYLLVSRISISICQKKERKRENMKLTFLFEYF